MTLHNEMFAECPALLETLYQPFYQERKGEQRTDRKPYYIVPIFSELDGQVTCRYNRAFIERGHAYPEVPGLTERQIEAMDTFDALAEREDLNLTMSLELGDIQFLNNYVALHGRNAYQDHEAEADRRRMFRLWLTLPNGRPLPHWFEGMYGSIEPGQPRTGFPPVAAN